MRFLAAKSETGIEVLSNKVGELWKAASEKEKTVIHMRAESHVL